MNQYDGLWHYVLALYGQPGVDRECLALQDDHRVRVNLLLFACWLSGQGTRVQVREWAQIVQTTEAWHERVIQPLRESRRWLKPRIHTATARKCRDTIKGAELLAEQVEIEQLAHMARPWQTGRADTTLDNADTYLRYCHVPPARRAQAVGILQRGSETIGGGR